jgi:hypothetical protein
LLSASKVTIAIMVKIKPRTMPTRIAKSRVSPRSKSTRPMMSPPARPRIPAVMVLRADSRRTPRRRRAIQAHATNNGIARIV